ncbi:diaminopropionate ammonia-lyase [Leptolyngbya iicbica LK]|uniref:Diaminopropionate ammonia-lyase n=3 Tax=Cyanophyceae TaxID=3028117 RepID=A0A4Q7EH92_9CYAN|nr:diaminopropionate ammonia-lyase [Leptolyngbya sp. LK]
MTPFANLPVACLRNPQARRDLAYDDQPQQWLSLSGTAAAWAELHQWSNYQPTPLRSLPEIATDLDLDQIWYKDESDRFGLGSFKALGGAYAVFRQLVDYVQTATGQTDLTAADLLSGRYRELTQAVTVTTATDGNHGRSVAWGAQQFGCRCVIYLHAGVSAGREAAIAAYGAEMVRVAGNYDDSVRQAAEDAQAHGWILVSDTAHPGNTTIPSVVMQGYTVMVAEVFDQLPPDQLPTHVFVQAGVGGLAAAVCAYLWERWGRDRPTTIVVEPDRAACVYATAQQGKLVTLEGDQDTLMACLSSGHTSTIAWDILRHSSDWFITIPDEAAVLTMQHLAHPRSPIVGGESGVASLAGLLTVGQRSDLRQQLGLTTTSRVLTFGTEGATDPEIYQKLINRSALHI